MPLVALQELGTQFVETVSRQHPTAEIGEEMGSYLISVRSQLSIGSLDVWMMCRTTVLRAVRRREHCACEKKTETRKEAQREWLVRCNHRHAL